VLFPNGVCTAAKQLLDLLTVSSLQGTEDADVARLELHVLTNVRSPGFHRGWVRRRHSGSTVASEIGFHPKRICKYFICSAKAHFGIELRAPMRLYQVTIAAGLAQCILLYLHYRSRAARRKSKGLAHCEALVVQNDSTVAEQVRRQ
jgi:hypothetical protein